MCGICGLIHLDEERPVDETLLRRMTDIIAHRGPDDEGRAADGNVGLGARRLSIVGLRDGHMPMATAEDDVWVVYNGELYNHPALREDLSARGHQYRTGADTESFLHLYREYGEAFLEYARGMFAIALWDRKRKKLILGRDRLGIKPLYYHFDGRTLRFGSEIKSILCDPEVPRELDPDALNLYLSYLGAPAPYTLFKGIRQLMPGQQLTLSEGRMALYPFWRPADTIHPNHLIPPEDAKRELARRFKRVIQEHLLSDVPVGAFLSGGIDSSIIACLMREELGPGFKTFSIGFEGHGLFDETHEARRMARKLETDHYEKKITPADLLEALDDITWQLDDPLADSSCLPVYYVSKLASSHGKVILSGDGGDEVFAGYRKYLGEHYRKYFDWIPETAMRGVARAAERSLPESRAGRRADAMRQVKKFLRGLDPDPLDRHRNWAIHFDDALRREILHPDTLRLIDFDESRRYRELFFHELKDGGDLTRMLWVDLRHGLPSDMLAKVDRMSMLHSLEVRVPFLDHTLAEFAFSLPDSYKLRGKTTKWILREAFADILPADVLTRPKHGFDVPVGEWFRHELRDVIEDVCSEATIKNRGLFSPGAVRNLLDSHMRQRRDFNNQLWILLSLELWQRCYLDLPPGDLNPRPV